MGLADQHCVPCQGDAPLTPAQYAPLLGQVSGWQVLAHKLTRLYSFPNFAQGLAWVNRIGALAEAEGHHPDIFLAWGQVKVEIWTHAAGGLTEADFVLAAKIDRL